MTAESPREHWDAVYGNKDSREVSWFQPSADVSARLVGGQPGSVVDVGAGASVLVDELLAAGRSDLTLLDVSRAALAETRRRLGTRADEVAFVVGDVLDWDPGRTYDCWHDRAVFHFLTDPVRQQQYVATAARAVRPGGALVLGTFGPDGPTSCSGLPTARWAPEELAAVFAEHASLEHAETEVHRTPWGSEQQFTWVVLRRTSA
ncbi:class I SAM-dependent methyltransferase [Nocardioides guangzhouensis]|uniref:Class I SAM-dependent methyltransferase n=1 Tax=Nocardioides guangzhouensis TaxID=2497878 RepID=A0A4Q4ZLY7_9ACTN|nr:class I SAM-dependent methyltransferase [Nocardioides guangzhouensis]RYP89068.1 class I SAM-dependent methyltransferase [Nocardioides guangzhouensis]